MIIVLITSLLIAKCSWCLPLDQLYPYGPNENDRVLDSSYPVSFFNRFFFDSTIIGEVYIRPNGIITLNVTSLNSTESTSTDTPMPFPIEDLNVIAPYWFDSGFLLDTCNEPVSFNKTIDFNTTSFANKTFFVNETTVNETSTNETGCRYSSTAYYGNRYSSFLRDRATREIRAAFFDAGFFTAYNLFVVTWVITDNKDDLPEPKKSVFQCILAYSGLTYVIFNYADGLSLLNDKLNIQAGINAAFRPTANFASIPNTSNISVTSNVGIPGVWMFQINTRPFTRPFAPLHVTINTTDEQVVGQSFTMECRIQRAENINSTFDIIWSRRRGGEERRVNNISGSLISNYSDFYTILLRRNSREHSYRCDVIINLNQPLNTSAEFWLNNVTQPLQLIISPTQSPLRVTVGSHLPIYCTAVEGVPVPQVQWYSEGFPVYPSQSFYQQAYVVPTDSPHTTTYTCVGTRYSYRRGEVSDLIQLREVSELRVNVTVIVEEPCPRLQRPRRGEVTITEDRQLAFFSCNRGFTMRGSSILKCRNGKWDSSPPTCNSISGFCRQRCNF